MKATVIGSWHLASVYAAGLATLGHEVRLVSGDDAYQRYLVGEPPVFEPGLGQAIREHSASGRLAFSSDISDPANAAPIAFLAEDVKVVPSGVDIGSVSESFRRAAASGNFRTVSISSQLPVGTARELARSSPGVALAYLPEFLRLGDALNRFLKPDYIVVGGEPEVTASILELFSAVECPKFQVTLEEAEMAKHAANAFMALTVSFISELTKFSRTYDIDFSRLGEILRCDKRIGSKAYVLPGMGFSGETVERDLRVLLSRGKELGVRLPLLEEIIPVNEEHNRFIERALQARFPDFKGLVIGFLGATYKPVTSTLRGSIFAELMINLSAEGADVRLFDPHVKAFDYLVGDPAAAFDGADAVVIAVAKPEFRGLDFAALTSRMRRPAVIDAANLLPKDLVRALKLDYECIGRGRL